ncbi:MAG TPA: glucose-6-phosphate isomerase [Rhodanobacteraceae bacterium]|nr:glucose-6-phosphate isomerase [Rhodanobacteraceae bacterium]
MLDSDLALLAGHAARLRKRHLRDLVAEPDRAARHQHRVGPLLIDFSRQKIDDDALEALGAIAERSRWADARDAMFRGEPVNTSEKRAVLHTALRAGESHLPALAPRGVLDEIGATQERMESLVDAIHGGTDGGIGLATRITDVVNLGIGGSDLGPRLAVESLAAFGVGKVRCHFLPNVDGHRTAALMRTLDPRRTLVLLVSKSFSTQETLLNGHLLREWLRAGHAGDSAAADRHFVAVSANVEAARAFGVPPGRVLPMWDFVGGRYSVWSAAGLVVALALGMPGFRALLRGAAAIDDHFRSAPWRANLPVLLALVGAWNRNALGCAASAVVPYLDSLAELPAYLQQLEMESLGKSATPDGAAVAQATVPVIWGNVGTNAQHAFFQALHQGTDVVPVDFVGVVRAAHGLQENHAALLANLLAQGAALALGKTREEALADLGDGSEAERRTLAAQRTFPGDRPSTTILLDALTPESLGMLLALHEHKVFVQSLLWNVNAFDQWGVELGKTLAKTIQPALAGSSADSLDAATRALIAAIRSVR